MTVGKKKPEKKAKCGPRTKYDPEIHPDHAKALAMRGFTNKEIAAAFGISLSTLQEWIKKIPELSEAIKTGKEPANAKVENAIFKSCMGYYVEETRGVVVGNGDSAHVQKVTESRFIPPNFQAQRFWSKNRMGDRWRDVQEVEHSGNIQINIDKDDAGL